MTNFEKIKTMNVSEMAQFIDRIEYNSAHSEFVEDYGLDINEALEDTMWDINIVDWLNMECIEG